MIPFFFVPGYWFVIKTERCKWKMKSNNDLRIEADMGRTTAPCCLLPFVLLYFSTWLSSRTLSQDTHTHTQHHPNALVCLKKEVMGRRSFLPPEAAGLRHTWTLGIETTIPADGSTLSAGPLSSGLDARVSCHPPDQLSTQPGFCSSPRPPWRKLGCSLLHVDRSSGQAKVEGEMPQSQS